MDLLGRNVSLDDVLAGVVRKASKKSSEFPAPQAKAPTIAGEDASAGTRYEVRGNVDVTIALKGKPAKTITAAGFAKANGKIEITVP